MNAGMSSQTPFAGQNDLQQQELIERYTLTNTPGDCGEQRREEHASYFFTKMRKPHCMKKPRMGRG
jgi:hypothetical protein